MKKFKKGFTLAEVLISVGIIGVIASLTMPNLMVSIQRQQVGPSLAKAISTLENANRLALSDSGVRNLRDLARLANGTYDETNDAYFSRVLAPYLGATSRERGSYKAYNMSTNFNNNLANNVYTTKDGITFIPASGNNVVNNNAPRQYGGRYYVVYIDINGQSKGVNSVGRDLYQVVVDVKGDVFPVGSDASVSYVPLLGSWRNGCASARTNPADALTCAGSVADNGFKAIHKM